MADDQLTRIEKKVDHISDWIDGNGQPGAKIRIDRNTRDIGIGKWLFTAFGAAVVVLMVRVGFEIAGHFMTAHGG